MPPGDWERVMGAMTTRLGSVSPLNVKGSNSGATERLMKVS